MSRYFDSLSRRASVSVVPAPEQARPAMATTPAVKAAPPAPYRALREKLLALANGRPFRTIVFAGCDGREGCTRIVQEFARTLADSGLNVLLVNADQRAPAPDAGGLAPGTALTELVSTGSVPPATSYGKGRLTLVRSPASVPDKERFFGAPEFAAWLDAQRSNYDYVLLDSRPLCGSADANLMGRLSDGVIIVVRAEATERESLVRARDQLQRAGVNVVGVVLNRPYNPIPLLLQPYLSSE